MAALLSSALLVGGCRGGGSERDAQPLRDDLRAVLAQVAQLRGIQAPAGIEAGTTSREEVRELLQETLTDTDRDTFRRLTDLYRLVGFIGPDDDYEELYLDFASRALIGFYHPARDTLWLVDGGDLAFNSFDATLRSTVAHEFVHALQDSKFDLPPLLERASGDLDWSLALSAVIEGDAVHYERLWAQEHLTSSDVSGTPVRGVTGGSIPAAIERELRWPYEGGLDWVSLLGKTGGNRMTDEVLGGSRITTAEILHPELRSSGWRPRDTQLPDLSPALGSGWRQVGGGTFGEFRLRNLLQLHVGGLPAVAAAAGWNGDRFAVYTEGERSVAVLFFEFIGAEGQEFHSAMTDWLRAAGAMMQPESVGTLPDGRAVAVGRPAAGQGFLVFGSNREAVESVLTALNGG